MCEKEKRRDLVPEPSGGSRATPTAGESRCGFGPGGVPKGLSLLLGKAASGRLRSQTSWWPAMGATPSRRSSLGCFSQDGKVKRRLNVAPSLLRKNFSDVFM